MRRLLWRIGLARALWRGWPGTYPRYRDPGYDPRADYGLLEAWRLAGEVCRDG